MKAYQLSKTNDKQFKIVKDSGGEKVMENTLSFSS